MHGKLLLIHYFDINTYKIKVTTVNGYCMRTEMVQQFLWFAI